MSLRSGLLASIVTGALIAVAVALLVPRTQPSLAADVLTGRSAPIGDVAHPRVAPARRELHGPGRVILRTASNPRIEARLADPLGGPPWAIRAFEAVRLVRDPGESPHVIGRPRCAQLGRLYRGRFGWVDVRNTFRPVGISYRGAPYWCGSILPDERRNPQFDTVTRITDPAGGVARPTEAVAWGIVGPAGTPRLEVDGRTAQLSTGASGSFLAVVPHDHTPFLQLAIDYANGPPLVQHDPPRPSEQPPLPGPRLGPTQSPRRLARPQLDLRLPDPNGGLAWGVSAVPASGGGWCSSRLGRIVGDRVGAVDYELGTFHELYPSSCPPQHPRPDALPNRRHPLDFMWGGAGPDGEPGEDPEGGRVARRTQRGIFELSGHALATVREITIASPRDVRTIRPSPRTHAFAALYDGSFPTGKILLTSRMVDGTTRREVIPYTSF
jgi:hypothetical protein